MGALALAVVVVLTVAGCTAAQMGRLQRWQKYPTGYDETPLGRDFDTPAEVRQLKDDTIRDWMEAWFDLQDTYLRLWRERGAHDAEVKRVKNRLDTWTAVIRDRATQLAGMGQPLS